MTTVFIAGSISISHLHDKVRERIGKIVASDFNIVVGDADGADTSIQHCLSDHQAKNVLVYCTGDKPRNNVAAWPVHKVHSKARFGSRAYFTAKDLEMARSSDYGLMIWDSKSTGTLSNVIELLARNRKSVVFINKNKEFMTISGKADLDVLLGFMSEHARARAEEKIGLSSRLAELAQTQFALGEQQAASASNEVNRAAEGIKLPSEQEQRTESLRLRFELMSALKEYIHGSHMSQSQAAKVFGVTQPRISDLTRDKVDLFGLDALVNMASAAGLHVELRVRNTA